ncbi:MAG: hypothetical protein ACI9VR_000825 [Cognaticolwellia sp.]|jgi:hypothetical protein
MQSNSAELLRAWPTPWLALDAQGLIVAMNPAMERFCRRLSAWLGQSTELLGAPLQALHSDLVAGTGTLALGMETWAFQAIPVPDGQVIRLEDRSRSSHLSRFVDSAQGASDSLSNALSRQAGSGLAAAHALQSVASNTRDSAVLGRQIFEQWIERVDQALEQMGQLSTQVGERVALAMDRSEAISRSSTHAIELLQAVSTQVAQMRSLAEGVDEIMVQTRMLSINARIEAARAGEHGHSFAIVANEVGTLAARTEIIARRIEQVAEQVLMQAPQCQGAMDHVSSCAKLGKSNAEALQVVMEKQDGLIASVRDGLSGDHGPRVELYRHLGAIQSSAVQCAEQAERSQSGAQAVEEIAEDLAILSERFKDSDRISPSDVYREVLDLNECLRAWVVVHMPGLASALGPLACVKAPGRMPQDVLELATELQEALCVLIEEPFSAAPPPLGPITPAQVHDRVATFVRILRQCLSLHGVEVHYSAPVRGQTQETVYGALKQLEKRIQVVSMLRRLGRRAA